MVPDLTMRGQDDPHGRAVTARPPTIGLLAARVHALAARPADWWRLIGFDDAGPVRVPLAADGGVPVWLTTWPPGHDAALDARVSTLIAGELTEVLITPDGVTERPLRANRVRVHAAPRTLTNPGPAYAVTLHA